MTKAENKRALLRKILNSGNSTAVGVHDGLTAKICSQYNFDALWASGLEISASYGILDANIISLEETIHNIRIVVSSTDLPVIVDGDSGYGNALNVIRTVEKIEGTGAAGWCLEDNVFPKKNSFFEGVRRHIVSIHEQVKKIEAAKSAQYDADFVLIARTEALIQNMGLKNALERCRAYADAGADAVLIHSKQSEPSEIFNFMENWDRDTPVIAIPTTYYNTSSRELFDRGISLVIFANHGMRASIKAIESVMERLSETGRISDIECQISNLEHVFQLLNIEKLKKLEHDFL